MISTIDNSLSFYGNWQSCNGIRAGTMVLIQYVISGRLHEVGESQQEELVDNWQEENDSLILNPFARTHGNSFLLLIPRSICVEK
jgi:hypothetical protein